mgnify:CR=1 FL=1
MLDDYIKQALSIDKLVSDINEAVKLTEEKAQKEDDKDKREMYNKQLEKIRVMLAEKCDEEKRSELLAASGDILMTWLDKLKGKEVTENSIFSELPRHYESEFHKDMAELNVIERIGKEEEDPLNSILSTKIFF